MADNEVLLTFTLTEINTVLDKISEIPLKISLDSWYTLKKMADDKLMALNKPVADPDPSDAGSQQNK